jgi:hypothetical protein
MLSRMNENLDPKTLRERARRIINEVRKGEPGERFIRYWHIRQRRERERRTRKVMVLTLGFFLVAVGVVLGPTPVAPGFVAVIPGLAILAARIRIVARILDKGELFLRRIAAPFTSKINN